MDTTRLHNSDGSELPHCNLQEVVLRPLLGLKLTKTQALTSLLQRRVLSRAGDHNHDLPRPITDNVNVGSQILLHHHQPMSEKLKASNFPINTISIGPWKRVSRHEGELTAKLYFAKRKLVWEFLEGQLKSKIEVLWSDITAIKALMPPHQPGTLQIELGKPPLFFREIKPQPRKHTNWQQAPDFTEGHAPLYRRHYARFPPGVLDRHYEKLVQCDQHLLELSRNPFPTHQDLPFFNTTPDHVIMPFNNFTGGGVLEHQYNPTPPLPLIPAASPPPPINPIMTAVVNFPHIDMVESPTNTDHHQTLLLGNQTTAHNIGMNMNYFHEGSSAGGSHLHQLIPSSLVDLEPAAAAGSFLSLDIINPQCNHIQIHDNLTVPNYNSYVDNPPITWLPPTLEGSSNNCIIHLPPPMLDADTKPNFDLDDDHINNLGGYGNHHHHRQY